MISDERYDEIVEFTEDMPLDAVWHYVIQDNNTYAQAKDVFICILEKMLISNRIKLAKNGEFLEGNIQYQVNLFRETFPPFPSCFSSLRDIGNWFFSEECPGGAVWIHDDGTMEWT